MSHSVSVSIVLVNTLASCWLLILLDKFKAQLLFCMLFFALGRKVVHYFSAQCKKVFFLPRAEKYCTSFSPAGLNIASCQIAIEVKKTFYVSYCVKFYKSVLQITVRAFQFLGSRTTLNGLGADVKP